MKHRSFNRVVFVLFLFLCLGIWGCKIIDESYDPDPTTEGVSKILLNTACIKCKFNQDKTWVRIKTLGCCWSTSENPTVDDEKIEMGECSGFDATIEGLNPDTKYYVRAYATTSKETFYGNILEFKTMLPTVKDVDGNLYNLIQFENIVITTENLKTTKYNNGDPIAEIKDAKDWANSTSGARCAYGNDESNVPLNGYLYNWRAVSDSRGICPSGWYIPTSNNWSFIFSIITEYYKKQIEEYSFSAKGGQRYSNGNFSDKGTTGRWWSSTEGSQERAFFFPPIEFEPGKFAYSQGMKQEGMSVRWAYTGE